MTVWVGHDEAWKAWRGALASERMHHAWILTGQQGLGKASFAVMAAAELVAEPDAIRPAPHMDPDIIRLAPLPATDDDLKKRDEGKPYQTKRSISVDQIREMQRRLNTRPTLGARRAIIIDAADQLEKNAVNALLKSLEEPPEGTFFLLVVHALGRILPTVRSRCLVVRFSSLSQSDVARALDNAEPLLDADTRQAALAIAGGSPGAAIAFASQELGKAQAVFAQLLERGDHDLALRGKLASALGARPDRERQLSAIEAARMTVVRMLPHVDDAARLRLADAHEGLVRLAADAPTYNFDPGLLMLEIGALLAAAAPTREGTR